MTFLRVLATALCLMLGLGALPDTAHADDGPDLIVNGGFESFDGALPDSWSKWAPAGTGSISRIDGVSGDAALALTTDTPTSRLALTQDVTLSEGGGLYRLTYQVWRSGMAGSGQSGVRVNYLDGDGAGGAVFVGLPQNTDGWVTEERLLQIPSNTTKIRVHLFNDVVQGTLRLDDVSLVRPENQSGLIGTLSAAGDIALSWSTEVTGIDHYDILRGTESAPDQVVRSVPGTVLRATDHSWSPGVAYTYQVVGYDAAGTELMRTTEATVTATAADPTTTASIALSERHLTWRAAANAATPLRVLGADGSVLVDGLDVVGSHDLSVDATSVTLVDATGATLATATRASLAHPRLGLDAQTLETTRRIITEGGTPQQAWETILTRVEDGLDAFTSTPDRYAREAAFVYQVTGETRYADLAYDAMLVAIDATPISGDKELEVANPVSSIALTYDWAWSAWTEQQRQTALDYFALTADHMQFGDSPNLVLPDKASNWVGVVRGAELAQHLVARGDGDYGWQDARLTQLIDELDRHLRASTTDLGWFQEGLDYLDYTAMISTPGIQGSFDQGIDALRDAWFTPATTDLILHSIADTTAPARLQWGVADSAGSISFPLYLDRVPAEDLATYLDLYERVQGHRSDGPWYSPGYVTTLFTEWPQTTTPVAQAASADTGDAALPALLDTEAGAGTFRDRVQDADDVLLTMNSRNHQHLGWSGYDSFGLSLIGMDTVWAKQPGKSQTTASLYSRVLIDEQATQATGHGVSTGAREYTGQGGGYWAFDAAGNVGVDTATRESIVDFSGTPTVVLSDRFADDAAHDYVWQLVPQSGVTAELAQETGEFTLRNGDAWLHGVLLDAEDATMTFDQGVFRIARAGVSDAGFDLVLTLGRGEVATTTVDGRTATVGTATYDFTALSDYEPVVEVDPGDGGQEPGGEPGTDPGTGPGTGPGTDPGTGPGTDAGTDPSGSGTNGTVTTITAGDSTRLARTGSEVATLALAAAGLLVLGAALLTARRRTQS